MSFLIAKANKIADQSSDELAKSIGQTANQLQILGKRVRPPPMNLIS